MTTDDPENNAPEEEPDNGEAHESIPVGIVRIREEWRAAGLLEGESPAPAREHAGTVVFSEIDGGAGIGDYVLDPQDVRDKLALSEEAFDRLISSGEIDSIVVQGSDGVRRRMISESSVKRFEEDSAIDPNAVKRAARAMADRTVTEAIQDLRAEINDFKDTQGKVLQQMKDMLLLEVRNLKEQQRDLTSFAYELAEELRGVFSKKKK